MMYLDKIAVKRRIAFPKKLWIRKCRAIVIPASFFFIPIRESPQKEAKYWTSTNLFYRELKIEAEKLTEEDVITRLKGTANFSR